VFSGVLFHPPGEPPADSAFVASRLCRAAERRAGSAPVS